MKFKYWKLALERLKLTRIEGKNMSKFSILNWRNLRDVHKEISYVNENEKLVD